MAIAVERWKGLNGPIEKKDKGYFTTTSELDAIKASVLMSIATDLGSRVRLRRYGSTVMSMVFEQNDSLLKSLCINSVQNALAWEPRVVYEDCTVERYPNENKVQIAITLREASTNELFTIEFGRVL